MIIIPGITSHPRPRIADELVTKRQEPQGAENNDYPLTPRIPHPPLANAKSANDLNTQNQSKFGHLHQGQYQVQNVSSKPYALYEASGNLNDSYINAQLNSVRTSNVCNISDMSKILEDNHMPHLPENFSKLSETEQQQLLDKLLYCNDAISERLPSNTPSKLYTDMASVPPSDQQYSTVLSNNVDRYNVVATSRDSGIVGDMQTPVKQKTMSSLTQSTDVVSLPNHSSSMNVPESPGPHNRNE